jgi:hypothetical protein
MSALMAPGPEKGHWRTHKDVSKDAPSTTGCDYAQHDIAGMLESRYREDAEILNKSRHLGDGKGNVVDPKTRPECLEGELVMLGA